MSFSLIHSNCKFFLRRIAKERGEKNKKKYDTRFYIIPINAAHFINPTWLSNPYQEELLEKLHKKLEVLKEGKLSLQQEIADNDLLGTQVSTIPFYK